jgi:hypothetical protein
VWCRQTYNKGNFIVCKKYMWWHMPVIPASGGRGRNIVSSRQAWATYLDPAWEEEDDKEKNRNS